MLIHDGPVAWVIELIARRLVVNSLIKHCKMLPLCNVSVKMEVQGASDLDTAALCVRIKHKETILAVL